MAITVQMLVKKSYLRRLMVGVLFVSYVFPIFSYFLGEGHSYVFPYSLLVGGFNPSEKYARQIGSFPQFSG